MQEFLPFLELVAVPLIGYIFYYLNKLEKRLNDEMSRTKNEVSTWQLEVVRNYVTRAEMEKLEQRIVGAVERLEKRIETHFFKKSGE